MELTTLQRGRESFEKRAWAESYRLLQAADRDAPLDATDLERLAIAAWLVGRDDECEAAIEQALTANESIRKTMADYHDLVASGRREIYRIES